MILISAYSTKAAVIDNLIAIATWWTSLMFRDGHFEKVRPCLRLYLSLYMTSWAPVRGLADMQELKRVESLIERRNRETFNPAGLNVLSPRYAALQFVCPLCATSSVILCTDTI